MSVLTGKTKTPDAQEALDNAIDQATKSAVLSQMWSLISISQSLIALSKKR